MFPYTRVLAFQTSLHRCWVFRITEKLRKTQLLHFAFRQGFRNISSWKSLLQKAYKYHQSPLPPQKPCKTTDKTVPALVRVFTPTIVLTFSFCQAVACFIQNPFHQPQRISLPLQVQSHKQLDGRFRIHCSLSIQFFRSNSEGFAVLQNRAVWKVMLFFRVLMKGLAVSNVSYTSPLLELYRTALLTGKRPRIFPLVTLTFNLSRRGKIS